MHGKRKYLNLEEKVKIRYVKGNVKKNYVQTIWDYKYRAANLSKPKHSLKEEKGRF